MIDIDVKKKIWLMAYIDLRNEISRREHDLVLSSTDNDCFTVTDIYAKQHELKMLKQNFDNQTNILLSMVANQDFVHQRIVEYYYVRNLKLQTIATMLGYSTSHIKAMKKKAFDSLDAKYIDM